MLLKGHLFSLAESKQRLGYKSPLSGRAAFAPELRTIRSGSLLASKKRSIWLSRLDASAPIAAATISAPVADAHLATSSQDNLGDTVPGQWARLAVEHGDLPALIEPHRKPAIKLTYRETAQMMREFASGLHSLGLQQGDRVSIFSEDSSRWLIADQGVQMNGAADAVRGADAPVDELLYILRDSGSCALLVQDLATLRRLLPEMRKAAAPRLKFVALLWGSPDAATATEAEQTLPGTPIVAFEDVMARGQQTVAAFNPPHLSLDDLATLVYTSGTTGRGRGAILTHANLMYQVRNLVYFVDVQPGERTLSLLPSWHIYQRIVSYHTVIKGAAQVYSSIRKFRDDLVAYPPDHFICVPVVLETLRSRVLQKFAAMPAQRRRLVEFLVSVSTAFVTARRVVQGVALQYAKRDNPRPFTALVTAMATMTVLRPLHELAKALVFKKVREAITIRRTVISGGGSLPPALDDFYEAIGIEVVNGWGLTETSPVLTCRRSAAVAEGQNVRGSIGKAIPGTELRVVDVETLEDLPDGTPGLVLARGPGVLKGYYNDDASTSKAFRAGTGWFDTGDVGWRAPDGVPGSSMAGNIILTGRSKDTIVLSNGKKVEPQPLEDAIQSSPYIKFCILIGQDRRALGALLFLDEDAVAPLNLSHKELQAMMTEEVGRLNRAREGYHSYDNIAAVEIARSPLTTEAGTITRTMKPRRVEIMRVHKPEVDALLARLR